MPERSTIVRTASDKRRVMKGIKTAKSPAPLSGISLRNVFIHTAKSRRTQWFLQHSGNSIGYFPGAYCANDLLRRWLARRWTRSGQVACLHARRAVLQHRGVHCRDPSPPTEASTQPPVCRAVSLMPITCPSTTSRTLGRSPVSVTTLIPASEFAPASADNIAVCTGHRSILIPLDTPAANRYGCPDEYLQHAAVPPNRTRQIADLHQLLTPSITQAVSFPRTEITRACRCKLT